MTLNEQFANQEAVSTEKEDEYIDILLIEPLRKPKRIHLKHTLENLQNAVEGHIQSIYPFEDPVAIICNDDGKIIGLYPNRSLRDDDGEIYDIIFGNMLITGLTFDNFGSLSEDMMQKYENLFQTPERFLSHNGHILVFPVTV